MSEIVKWFLILLFSGQAIAVIYIAFLGRRVKREQEILHILLSTFVERNSIIVSELQKIGKSDAS